MLVLNPKSNLIRLLQYDVVKAERRSDRTSLRFQSLLRCRIRNKILAGDSLNFNDPGYQQVLDSLLDVMLDTYLRRYASAKEHAPFRFSLRDDVKGFASNLGLNTKALRKSFEPTTKRELRRATKSILNTVAREVSKGKKSGKTPKQTLREVNKALRSFGKYEDGNSVAQTTVRTLVRTAHSAATWQAYQDRDDLWGFEYVTARDGKVRLEHRRLDGMKRRKNDAAWQKYWPPNGWNCRCTVLPLFGSGYRSSRVPKVTIDDEFMFNSGVGLFK